MIRKLPYPIPCKNRRKASHTFPGCSSKGIPPQSWIYRTDSYCQRATILYNFCFFQATKKCLQDIRLSED